MLDEQRQINRNGCGDPRFTASAPADAPQFAHAPHGNGAIAGNSSEGLTLTGIKRTAKRGFQDREPRAPGTEIAKSGAEHPRIEQRATRSTDRLT
jgi:hypothetical protein